MRSWSGYREWVALLTPELAERVCDQTRTELPWQSEVVKVEIQYLAAATG